MGKYYPKLHPYSRDHDLAKHAPEFDNSRIDELNKLIESGKNPAPAECKKLGMTPSGNPIGTKLKPRLSVLTKQQRRNLEIKDDKIMAKCIGCKLHNVINEYRVRKSVTALSSLRLTLSSFITEFEKFRSDLRIETDAPNIIIRENLEAENNRLIYAHFPSICDVHIRNFKSLLETVAKELEFHFKTANLTIIMSSLKDLHAYRCGKV